MQFTNPVFLWAIGLALIPLWLHLSRRRKFKDLELGTLRFLTEARKPRLRKARFEDIILLLLRIFATILLALLFAGPTFPGKENIGMENREVILLLDASGSINPEMEKRIAKLANKAIRRSKNVTIAQFSDQVKSIDELEDYSPRPGSPTHFDKALTWALDRLLEKNTDSARVVLIGHFANTSLPDSPTRIWPPGIEVEVIPIAPKSDANYAVTKIDLRTPYQTDNMELEARLHLPEDATPAVTLEAEGYREEKTLLPGSDRVLFNFRPTRETVRGWISIKSENDAWPLDDRRPFVFSWVQRRRILLVDGNPGDTPFEGESYFLKKALEASGAEHGLSPFDPEVIYGLETREGLVDLSQYSAIALCGVNLLSSTEITAINNYVKNGGGLFIVLGRAWKPEMYLPLVDAGLFVGTSSKAESVATRQITSWDRSHPAMAEFALPESNELRSLEWREGYDLNPDSDWHPLAQFQTKSAVLMAKGRIIICAHPLNRAWTDLPRNPVFVPFVKSNFAFLADTKELVNAPDITTPGIDEARAPGWHPLPDDTLQIVATDPEESLISSAETSTALATLGLPDNPSKASQISPGNSISDLRDERRKDFWPWVALILLCAVIAESILATRPKEPGVS